MLGLSTAPTGSQFLTISVADVLTRTARREPTPPVPGQPPLAGAELVHAEAAARGQLIGPAVINDGWSILLDVTLASRPSAETWTYALRFGYYMVTAVYAGLDAEDSVRRRRPASSSSGRAPAAPWYGARHPPPDAIRAPSGPAASAARAASAWVSGAESASATAGSTRRGGPPGGAAAATTDAYLARPKPRWKGGACEFRPRRWPAVPAVPRPRLESAAAALRRRPGAATNRPPRRRGAGVRRRQPSDEDMKLRPRRPTSRRPNQADPRPVPA